MNWFKLKTYGYCAAPSDWNGWASIIFFVLIEIALAFGLIVAPALSNSGPETGLLVTWFAIGGAITMAFIRFTMVKTDGDWRWEGRE